jgi:protein SCO1/2
MMRAALVSAIVLVAGALMGSLVVLSLVGLKPPRGVPDDAVAPGAQAVQSLRQRDPGEDFYADKLIPRFTLVNQDGETVTQDLFEDGVVIVDFMFTHCPTICPIMTGVMADLTDRLADTKVRFVSMSVDPANDTPEVLRAYGERMMADFDRWTFLTGDYDAVENIVFGALRFNLSTTDDKVTLPDGSEMSFIMHPSHLVLVRPGRDVVNIYKYDDPEAIDRLDDRARWEAAALK